MSTPDAGPGPELGAENLLRLCEILYRQTGMVYGESKRYFIERRLFERMARSGSGSVASYLTLLRWNHAEVEQLINSFTINETYFYREAHQLQCLSDHLLPEIVANKGPGELVRIWSVPCATGEEPYSVALWLLENWRLVDAYHIEIVGSDIDTEALARAKEGHYGERAIGRLSPAVVAGYFEPSEPGMRRLIADIRESVIFTPANIVDAASMAAQGRFDVILCRNVLIYFDDVARVTAADHLHAALNPCGFLCLGHSESMGRISARFEPRRFGDTIVYQPAAPR